jgi:N-acetylmuramoyl-L-alanine amidase
MPGAIFERPSPNFDSRRGAAVDCLVIHDTDCREVGRALSWFESPRSRVSAHYVVDRDGSVYRCVADEARAWHAGDSVLDGRDDVDTYSIGIELVGFESRAYMPAQIDALVEMCAMLCRKYEIPVARIVGHQDIAVPAGRKSDPGPHFPWADVRGRVARQLGARAA